MRIRTYGRSGPAVIVLHGGPGAPGQAAPVARALGQRFRAIEPFQRGSGGDPLTVAQHVEDLRELIDARCADERPALVGSSWGAMLALAYACVHPKRAGPLVLVGCGTFDEASRARMREILSERTDAALRARLERLRIEIEDPDERLRAMAELVLPLYAFDPLSDDLELEACDASAHQETWDDMLRLQEQGVFPAAFEAIETPVLMLHGRYDPHPGAAIRESLAPFLPQLEVREWERCGHYPWIEREVREEFFAVLGDWLAQRLGER